MHYPIINVRQLGHHLESNETSTVVDITSALIFGSILFPEHVEDYVPAPFATGRGHITRFGQWIVNRRNNVYLPSWCTENACWLNSCWFSPPPATVNEKVFNWDGKAHVKNSLYFWGSLELFSNLQLPEQEKTFDVLFHWHWEFWS